MIADDHRYETFWPRFGAAIIDSFLLWPLGSVNGWVMTSEVGPTIRVAWFVFHSFSFVAYSVLLHGFFGQTLGKRVARIRVVALSGAPLGLRRAFLRDAVWIALVLFWVVNDLPAIAAGEWRYDPRTFEWSAMTAAQFVGFFAAMLWMALEFATMLWSAKRRSVHDFIGGSVVVRTTK